jgi:PAS domain S-box-containing protein/putative nucleotidyltransferase with HDIG domain
LLYAAFAALWIVASSYLLTVTVADPVLLGRIELAKGLVFVFVTSILLYFLLRVRGRTSLPEAGGQPLGTQRLLLIFSALALVVPLIGFAITRLYGPQIEREAYANLEVIDQLKAEQIENWMEERQADAEVLAGDDAFGTRVAQFVRKGQDAELSRLLLDRLDKLRSNYHYTKILLLNANGRVLLVSGEETTTAPVLPGLWRQALDSKQVQRRDIYRDEEGHIHLEWAVPIVVPDAQGERAVAVVVLRVTAQQFIFPLIQTWPTASSSGETLLVRREGKSVMYLNELRHRQDTALRMTLPLPDGDRPAAEAISSIKPGTVQGKDYRGVPVLAAYRPVAGTNWHIVAKVDRAEVMAPLRDLVLWISLIALAAIAAVSAAVMLLWRQQQRAYQVEMRERSMAAIEESERRYRAITQSANDAIIIIDSVGNVMGWNDSAGQMFGYTESEIAGQPLTGLMPERFRDRYREGWARVESGGERRVIDKTVELAGLRKDGGEFPLELSLAQWQTTAGRFFSATIRDISRRKLAEAKIQRLTQLYAALSQCNEAIVRCTSEEELFPRICRDAVQFGGLKMAWIGLIGEDSQVKAVAAYGEGTEYLEGIRVSADADDPFGRGPTGTAIRENQPQWCQDFQHDPLTAPWHERAVRFGWGSSASLPLLRNGVVVGVFTLYSGSVNDFDEAGRGLLVEMARDISFALDSFDREVRRKQAEQVLAESEQRFRGLVEQSLAGIYIIQDGRFVYVNPRFAEIFGYDSATELIGIEPLALVAEQDRKLVAENIRSRLEGEVQSTSYGFTAMRKDGSLIDVGVHGARATHLGRPAVIGLMQDVSEKKRAEEQIQHYIKQLEDSFMHTIEVATTLVEKRDPYTAGHEKRVALIAVAIGTELGLDAHRIEGLRVGGYVHDIGKIIVPAEILSKPGHLSAAEYELIKGHPQAGYDILKNVDFPWPVADIAYQHHERMDGSGYPRGLKGEEILLEARITTVADVVEAMSSHRPYRPGIGIEQGLAEIERGSGIHYDPVVVAACLRLFREKGYKLPA